MIQVQCPSCAKTYSVAEGSIGSQGNCASCGKTFRLVQPVDETRRSAARSNPDADPVVAREVAVKLIPAAIARGFSIGNSRRQDPSGDEPPATATQSANADDPSRPVPLPASANDRPKIALHRRLKFAAVGVAFGLAVLGIMLFMTTNNGTATIELSGPTANVAVKPIVEEVSPAPRIASDQRIPKLDPVAENIKLESAATAASTVSAAPPAVTQVFATPPAVGVPAVTPPDPTSAPTPPMDAGRFVSEQQILARWDAKTDSWSRVEPRAILYTGERLVVLPTFRPSVALPAAAQVTFAGESALEMERPLQEGASRMKVDYGRLVVVNSGGSSAQVELELAGLQGVATLGDADSAVAVDVRQWLPPGADPGADALLPIVELFAVRGKITWHEAGKGPTSIPANQVRIYMGKAPPETRGPFRAPDWIDARNFVGVNRDASIAVEAAIDVEPSLNISLEELVQHRHLEVQDLAARCLGALGQFESLLKLLANDKHYSYWAPEIDSLRLAVARGPFVATRMRETLTRIRPDDAERLYRLLWTPSNEELNSGEAARLVKNLEDPEMDIRVLTFDALRRITGASLFYRPEKRPDLNKVPIQKWKGRLSEGTIIYRVPPTPLTDFRSLESP